MSIADYPDMTYLIVNGHTFEVVDGVAREAIANFPIKKIVSEDASNAVALRDLDSGSYVLEGKFKPYAGATGIFAFASALLVNIIKGSEKSSVQVFYPTNNCVQFLATQPCRYHR